MAADADDIAVFLEEANELLLDFEKCILLLETLPDDVEVLNRAFRCAHTIKGGAGMVDFDSLQGFTHQLENLLDHLREGQFLCTGPVVGALLASADVIKRYLESVQRGSNEAVPGEAEARAKIAAVLSATPHSEQSAEQERAASAQVEPAARDEGALTPAARDGSGLTGGLTRVAGGLTPVAGGLTPVAGGLTPVAGGLTPFARDLTPVAAPVLPPVERASAPAPLPPPIGPAPVQARPSAPAPRPTVPEPRPTAPEERARKAEDAAATIRVPLQKIDRLVNLVGELVITQSMVSQETAQFTPARLALLQDAVGQLDRHCRELQEQVLGIRMIPVRSMFDRFNRVVRDLCEQTGKQVALELEGEETELDKTVIEKITDPLTHLVRNAIDHGLELPADRLAHGKGPQGTLTLSAYQRGSNIFIEVLDDGRGLDKARILAKARKQGLIGEHDKLSDEEAHALIFRPGFSTAEAVTELSGRGVGMDVVRRNVESLKGKISIDTVPGQRTRFRIQLPLTLAMIEGLALRVGAEVFLMPLLAVAGSFKPSPAQLGTLGESTEVVEVREKYVPLVRLHQVLQQEGAETNPCKGIIVVVDDGDRTFAVLADELLGQQQVVVKSLEANFQRVPGISGATVLGDGRVALIVDVGGLFDLGQQLLQAAPPLLPTAPPPVAQASRAEGVA